MHKKQIAADIFRAYDIRGIYGDDLYPETMLRIGLGLGTYAKGRGETSVVVGNDIRTTSPLLANALISGLLSSGIDVSNAGTTTFGVCAFSGWLLKKDIIAYVTASHLPPEWNGVKFYTGEGIGFSAEENGKIRDIVLDEKGETVSWRETGNYHDVDLREEYIAWLGERFKFEVGEKRIVLDCGNGSMGLVALDVMKRVKLKTDALFPNPDPSFPNRPSEPTELGALKEAVLRNRADFGAAFDGDGDRVVIVDDRGRMLSADQCGVIIAKDLLEELRGPVLANVECSMLIERELEKLGGKIERIPVGHTFLTLEAKRRNAVLGIESSGHYVIPSFFLFDDAMIIPLKLAEILAKTGKKVSELVDVLPQYPKARKNLQCDDKVKFEVIRILADRLADEYGADKINTMDGLRIDLKADGWVLIRASNTSPLIRVTVEGDTEAIKEKLMKQFVGIAENAIREF
ncbi:MAG TPA: phosphomannomutase/phosphoglucomutase [Methanophagales archaeon]|nr:phosphomannomutase/phosphoglucomutase [Methanophagales archaeon]